jgi:hypothetical protein
MLIALCLWIGLPRFRTGIDLMDEGCLACGAERVLEGQVPNRDFVSLQPPLSFYAAAGMFKLFGTSLASLRILGLGIYLLIPLMTYGIARQLEDRLLSLAVAIPATVIGIPCFGFVPFAVWQGVAATAAAVLLYFWAVRCRSRPWLGLAAGVMTAAAFLARQDQGFYAAISIAAYTLVLRFGRVSLVSREVLGRNFYCWVLGMAAGLLPWGIYWFAEGALPEMFKQLVVFPVTTYAKTSSLPVPSFSRQLSLAQNAIVALYYIPPVVQILVFFWLWRRNRRGNWQLREAGVAFILVWSALYYCQVLARSDVYHLWITLVPFFILCACGWRAVLEGWDGIQARMGTGPLASTVSRGVLSAFGVAVVAWFLVSNRLVLLEQMASGQELLLPRARVNVAGGAELEDFIKTVQRSVPADRSILCLPYQPMFYFLCERRNPTRWNYLWPGDQTAEDHAMLIQQARLDPPAVVIISEETEMIRYAPDILNYVHAGFSKAGEGSGFSVYVPK